MNGLNSNMYPSFMDQLQMDMNRNPEKYRVGYDAYQRHQAESMGLHVTDPSRTASFVPNNTYISNRQERLENMEQYRRRLQKEREARLEKERLERLANEPVAFKLCRRLVTTLTNIYNGTK